jgi:hypothetical protein
MEEDLQFGGLELINKRINQINPTPSKKKKKDFHWFSKAEIRGLSGISGSLISLTTTGSRLNNNQ